LQTLFLFGVSGGAQSFTESVGVYLPGLRIQQTSLDVWVDRILGRPLLYAIQNGLRFC
jgi:hypothetical protein